MTVPNLLSNRVPLSEGDEREGEVHKKRGSVTELSAHAISSKRKTHRVGAEVITESSHHPHPPSVGLPIRGDGAIHRTGRYVVCG